MLVRDETQVAELTVAQLLELLRLARNHGSFGQLYSPRALSLVVTSSFGVLSRLGREMAKSQLTAQGYQIPTRSRTGDCHGAKNCWISFRVSTK